MMKVLSSGGGEDSLKSGQSPPSGKHPEPEDLGDAAVRFLDLLGEAGPGKVGNGPEAEALGQHRGGDALSGTGEHGPGDERPEVSVPSQSAGIQGATEEEQSQVSGDAVLAQMTGFSPTRGPLIAEPSSHPASSMEPLPEPIRDRVERILVEIPGSTSQDQAGPGKGGNGPEAETLGQHRGGDALSGTGEHGPGDECPRVSVPSQSAGIQGATEEEQPQVSGDAVLAQMTGFSTIRGPLIAEPSSHPASSMEPLPEPIRNMVERVLVEVPGSTSRNEVRIQLSTEVLPGTAIRIFRQGGELIVEFLTESNEVQDFLLPHLASFREHLEARQGEPVAVSVQYMGQNHDGQSDGRSRERRTGWEIYEQAHERF